MGDQNSNSNDTQSQPTEDRSDQQPQNDAQVSGAGTKIQQVKQRALQELVPVIDSLNSEPERKYEILMTAARSASSDELLEKALEVATKIAEPNAKAEALVDILNEASFQESNS
ncbi:hypothetical protein HYS84_00245 [Candidatus Saccharibacteria bacterium]|nr:hypothetical protein [Candidatus Saccharibacteria bacterium]